MSQSLRSDAADNRARILDAARALFAADGLDVPMREIARRAGVGPATVYRRFPTKQVLVAEAFRPQVYACHAIIEDGLADPDPWHGLCLAVENLFALHARSRAATAALFAAFPRAFDLAAAREQAIGLLTVLMGRAMETGRMRRDVGVNDVVLLLMANGGLHAASDRARLSASRRFAELAIHALRV
ncbi:TetR/AcrR family transcriptional regulator [Dactylosporangium sucinum]|uniref:TetR family transcriptional regulator n=1 Tax=Dactylosporangium sucinum TaxID=1424081 RepID=A0A917TKR3_9ACTN|nr:TetR/AcrR family transcriptional regulator [Dactylosporangium sucinum]GGM26133.1 TetR family transcriptional regulator [Dactylosporangium sucinum]